MLWEEEEEEEDDDMMMISWLLSNLLSTAF